MICVLLVLLVNLFYISPTIGSNSFSNLDYPESRINEPILKNAEKVLENFPAVFTENQGQLENDNVRFYDQGGSVWFTDDGVWMEVREELSNNSQESGVRSRESDEWFDPMGRLNDPEPEEYKRVILKQEFVGANFVRPLGRERLSWDSNFFYGNDSTKWRTGVPNYQEIYYEYLYDGIDLRYYSNNNGLKYDFIVHPGADVNRIRLKYIGAEELEIDTTGNLIIKTQIDDVKDGDLFIYQNHTGEQNPIEGRFALYGNLEYGFEILDDYNMEQILVIDPFVMLEYSTLIGGNSIEIGNSIAVDGANYAYVTGETNSPNFPTTPGANDTSYNGGQKDVIIFKLDKVGSALVYSTFIGGSSSDVGFDIAVDTLKNAYITGYTDSSDFPVTSGANDTTHNGLSDVFILKLNQTGVSLDYCTYIGGDHYDEGWGIAINPNGNAFVTGFTYSTNFPVTPGAFDTIADLTYTRIFVLKINNIGSTLSYSTFVEGNGYDYGYDIALDANGNAYVTGYSRSNDFPTTPGAFSRTNTRDEVIVFKLNQTGSGLLYSTYIGGNNDEYGYSIIVDNMGYAYVTGWTSSGDFPTTPGAYDRTRNGSSDIFMLKLNQSGSGLVISTFIGGSDRDYAYGIDVDPDGNMYITGYTTSLDFPITPDAYNNSNNNTDAFVLELAGNGSSIIYSTFVGGNDYDNGLSIVLDPNNDIYVTGLTQSLDFPTTPGAFNRTFNGGRDIFVLKIASRPYINITSIKLFKENKPTTIVYSKLCPYTFKVNFIYTGNLSDLGGVRLTLDTVGSNIQLHWHHSTGLFSKLFDPNDYVTIDPSSSAYNYFYSWTVEFNITFDWTYPDENLNDIKVYAISTKTAPAWLNATNVYQVENDLVFNGSILVTGEDDQEILEYDLIRGGETLKWTGLTPVYENTTEVYPLADEFDVTVWDEDGNYWSDSPASGEEFYVESITTNFTYNTSYTYTINISNIPPQSDRTDEFFIIHISRIPPECDKSNETFSVLIDADNVTYSNPTPESTNWQLNTNVLVSVDITDIGGGVVNGKSVMYSLSTNNGTTWGEWKLVPGLKSEMFLNVKNSISLEKGKNNLIKWRAEDSVGNGPTESEPYRIIIDTEEIEFSNALPLPTDVSTTEEVDVAITISDGISGVNASAIEYSVSEDRGKTWSPWHPVEGYGDGLNVVVYLNLTFPNGTANRLIWRASDVAGNGPIESPIYVINVNTWMPQIRPRVIQISPPKGLTINTTSVELIWELDDKSLQNVTYDVYLENDITPDIREMDVTNTSLIVSELVDGETYYWKIIPRVDELEGLSLSGVWWFKIELPKEPEIFKVEITGPNKISLYPGENKSIELTITNLGTGEDMILLEIEAGLLFYFITLDNYSLLKIDSKSHGRRFLDLTLPKTAQPGIYEIIITAISMNSGQTEKDSHIVTIEILEANIDTEKTEFNFLILLIILILIVIMITLFVVVYKHKKRKEEEALLPGTFTIKPGALPTPVVALGKIPSTLKVPTLPTTAAIDQSLQPITTVTPTPMLAKSTQMAQPSVLEQAPPVQVPELPALPPAQPQDNAPETGAIPQTPVPTVVSAPSTPTVIPTPTTSPTPVVHLPESSEPSQAILDQQKPSLADAPSTQPSPVISPEPSKIQKTEKPESDN